MAGIAVEDHDGSLLIRAERTYDGVVGDPREFGPVAAALVEEARRSGDDEALVVALRASAWFERSRLENTKARRLLDQAVRRARAAGLAHRLAELLVTRAAITLELGSVTAAARDLDRAEATDGRVGAGVEFMRAVLLHNLGRLEAAGAAYRRVLADPASSLDNRGSAANNLALIACVQGRFDDSLGHLASADEIARDVGPSLAAFVAHNRGLVLAQSGRLAESLREFDRATDLFVAEEMPLGEHFIEYAEVLAELRLLREASDLAGRAAAELETQGVLLMAAEARLTVAQTALLAGDRPTAVAAAAHAEALFRRQRRTVWAARAAVVGGEAALLEESPTPAMLARLRRAAGLLDRFGQRSAAAAAHLAAARTAERIGRPTVARHCFRAVRERAGSGPVLLRLRGRLAAAHEARLDGRDDAVLRHCRAGLSDLARHRAALASTELRALASGHGVELGELGLGCLLRAGSAARVLEWTEQTRAAGLLAVAPPAPEAVTEERAALRALHAELAEARRENGAEPPDLLVRQAAAEARIRRATWRRSGPGGPVRTARTATEIRSLLGDRVLVSYVRHGDQVLAVVADARRTRLVPLGPLGPLRFESDALLFALRRLTRPGGAAALHAARTSAEHALRRLRELALAPLGVDLERPLVVVPTGDTHRVAWSAVHRGPVSVVPSASAWAATCTRPREGEGVLVVAGPDLPGAEREAERIAAHHAGAVVLRPPQATTTAVLDAMTHADLVHLSCHGELRADNPIFSALRMSDGPLTVHELDLRGAAPRRIVLAACDSAADAVYAGDELLGFVGALLARGAAGVVASVVAVGDLESVDLMDDLHQGLAGGLTTAEALHRARARIDTGDHRRFVNWCAFAAYGAG
ncbi:MAG TPA: CHAT domain-containing protein [Pseudonocardia sp.]|nr:CHAT domain-containing protein [Pseudonocardia sp.]